MCIHPSCMALPLASRQFPTWSSLQKHSKSAHPPTCHYSECSGKTFTTARGLKWHLQIHSRKEGEGSDTEKRRKRTREKGKGKQRESEEEAEETATDLETGTEVEVEDEEEEWDRMESEREERMDAAKKWEGSRKRRRLEKEEAVAAEIEQVMVEEDRNTPFACHAGKCKRRFKSPYSAKARALTDHTSLKHSVNTTTATNATESPKTDPSPSAAPAVPVLDLLTGANYNTTRKFACPYPAILSISQPLELEDISDEDAEEGEEGAECAYAFGRIYDLERHLRSWHRIEVHREELREWMEGDE
ncbi:hypothetical protein P7C70_g338, partial [Phenoliferia sp. Uapishka_3]